MSNDRDARNRDILNLHDAGLTFEKIGKLFGITTQQAHLVYHSFPEDHERNPNLLDEADLTVEEYHALGYTISWIAQKLHLTPLEVAVRLNE